MVRNAAVTGISRIAVVVAVGLASSASAIAAGTDTQTVNFTIAAINEISVSDTAVSLSVDSASAGSAPTADTDNSSSYAITSNAGTDSKRITANISTAMPANVTLAVELDAPSGATSAGTVTLSPTPVTVVSGIEGVAESGLQIAYTLSATVAAAPITGTRTVTYTIADAS